MPFQKGHKKLGGKPKGFKVAGSKGELEAEVRRQLATKLEHYVDALDQSAQGVTHLMAKDRDGTWVQVTDPVIMGKVLNSGESFYRFSARNPDVQALKLILDRLCGAVPKALDVSGEVTVNHTLQAAVDRIRAARELPKPKP